MEIAGDLKGVNVIEPIKIDHPSQTTCEETFNPLEQVGLDQEMAVVVSVDLRVNESPTPSLLSDESTDDKPQVYVARRSSVFKRRLTFCASTDDNQWYLVGRSGDHGSTHSYKNVCQRNPEVDTDEERISLVEYNVKLKAEIQAWSSLRKLRKRKLREASKLPPEVLTMENVADILTEDDKAFLAEAPDYERIAKDLKSLVEESVLCTRIEEKAKIQAMTLLKKFEEQLNCITYDIINYSFSK